MRASSAAECALDLGLSRWPFGLPETRRNACPENETDAFLARQTLIGQLGFGSFDEGRKPFHHQSSPPFARAVGRGRSDEADPNTGGANAGEDGKSDHQMAHVSLRSDQCATYGADGTEARQQRNIEQQETPD
jgi:hypothetical protein